VGRLWPQPGRLTRDKHSSLIDHFIGDEEYKLNSSDCRTLFLRSYNEAKSAIPFVPGKLFQPRLKFGIKTGA
jgi:hypothetical protein